MPNRSTTLTPFRGRARQLLPEWMDEAGLAPQLHQEALAGLARLNRLSAAARPLARAIVAHCKARRIRQAELLDLASGSGDVPLAVARLAAARGISLRVAGGDRSALAVDRASRGADSQGIPARFFVCDALRDDLPQADFVTCSLFLHHLTEEQAVIALRRAGRAARQLLIVSDLKRSLAGYAAAWLTARAVTRSPVVWYDAPQSVVAAFSRAELMALAREAELNGATVRSCWPFRWLLEWTRGV